MQEEKKHLPYVSLFSWSIATFGANDSNNGDTMFPFVFAGTRSRKTRRTEHPKWAIATAITITAEICDFNKYFLAARVNCIHFVQRTWKTLAFHKKNVYSARGVRTPLQIYTMQTLRKYYWHIVLSMFTHLIGIVLPFVFHQLSQFAVENALNKWRLTISLVGEIKK